MQLTNKKHKDEGIHSASTNQYLKEIGKIPLLSAEEEHELAVKYVNGDKEAKNELIEHNLRLVVFVAKRFINKGSFRDIIQNGNLGLMKAVEHFDPSKGTRFTTYAYKWIEKEIRTGIRQEENQIKLPAYLFNDISSVQSATKKFTKKFGYEPTDNDIVHITGLSLARIKEAKKTPQYIASIEETASNYESNGKTSDDASTIGENLIDKNTDIEKQCEQKEMSITLQDAMRTLTERERMVITMRFNLDGKGIRTLREIGEIYGVRGEWIRQIEVKALEKLRSPDIKKKLRDFL